MRYVWFFLAAAFPAIVHATPPKHYYPTMTGDRLAAYYMGGPDLKGNVRHPNDVVSREMARGYMDGIKDATEGREWCFTGVKPDEMNEDIAVAIRKLPPAEQQGNAAVLVVTALRRLYPCQRGTQ